MDESTERLLSLAYLAYKRDNKRTEPSVSHMQYLVGNRWAVARLNVIATWAEEIEARVDRARLIGKLDVVFELLEEAGVRGWEWPWDEPEAANSVAWGLATLRWVNRMAAGRCPPRPDCSDDEVRDWLEAKMTRQLTLF